MDLTDSTTSRGTGSNGREQSRGTRDFTFALGGLRGLWDAYYVDHEHHVAKGLITAGETAHAATLAYDAEDGFLRLEVPLGAIGQLSTSQMRLLLGLNARARVTSAVFDREDELLTLRAASACPSPSHCHTVAAMLARDLQGALACEEWALAAGLSVVA